MLLQISIFASGMLKLVHVSAALNADVLPVKDNDIHCVD